MRKPSSTPGTRFGVGWGNGEVAKKGHVLVGTLLTCAYSLVSVVALFVSTPPSPTENRGRHLASCWHVCSTCLMCCSVFVSFHIFSYKCT